MPPPSRFDAELKELVETALGLRSVYHTEYRRGLEAPRRDGIGARVTGGHHTDPTQVAYATGQQARSNARSAVRAVRAALREIQRAETALGAGVRQPRRLPQGAVISAEDFDRALRRQRERVARGEE